MPFASQALVNLSPSFGQREWIILSMNIIHIIHIVDNQVDILRVFLM